MMQTHTVVVILEAKLGKENELKSALVELAHFSRQEKSCLEYRLHQDNNNPLVFVLYENWETQAIHQEQFSKAYAIDFIAKANDLLAKPYQVHMASEIGG